MTGTENLVLEILRRIQADLADTRERLRLMESRLGVVDGHLVALQLGIHANTAGLAANTEELRQMRSRIEHIERRLDLAEAPPSE